MAKPSKASKSPKTSKKPAAKPSAKKPIAAGGALVASDASTRTLQSLAATLGAPSDALSALLFGSRTEDDLHSEGTSWASEDILSSVPAIIEFVVDQWSELDAASRRAIRGFCLDVAALAIQEAIALEGMLARAPMRGGIEVKRRSLAVQRSETIAMRQQALDVLSSYVPATGKLRDAIDAGAGTAASNIELGNGLLALATLVEQAVSSAADDAGREALSAVGVDADYAAELRAAASAVKTLDASVVGGDSGQRITQAQLDTQDGRVMHVIEVIARAHAAAHRRKASIKMPPLGKLSRLLGSHRAPAKAAKTTDGIGTKGTTAATA